MKCPPNSHYELCADTCSLSCSALSAAPQCPDNCAEGCQCDPGFLSDGQACVPIQKCGCYHNGVYYEVGTGHPEHIWGLILDLRLPLPIRLSACPLRILPVPPTHPSPTAHGPTVIRFVPACLAPPSSHVRSLWSMSPWGWETPL